jgi:hypothetical protein
LHEEGLTMSETTSGAQPNWAARNFNWIAGVSSAVAATGVLCELSAGFGYRLQILP